MDESAYFQVEMHLGILFWLWGEYLQYLHKKEMLSHGLPHIKCRYGSCFILHRSAEEHF